MSGMKRRLVIAVVVCACFLPAHVRVQSGDDARRPAGSSEPAVSGDRGKTRHSTLNQITTQNMTKLGGVWTAELRPARAA